MLNFECMSSHWAKEILRNRIHQSCPQDLSQNFKDYACVALLIRGEATNPDLGFIVRAQNPQDRWSGQIAFPGGRREILDKNDIHTAIRETFEEIGLQLSEKDLLGKLNDVQARKGRQMLEFYIRPFVFYVSDETKLNLNPSEVAEFFWHPLAALKDPSFESTVETDWNGSKIQLPAIDVNRAAKLWGLSYLMTQDLLRILE